MTDQEIMEMWAIDLMRMHQRDLRAFWDLCDEFGIDLDIPF